MPDRLHRGISAYFKIFMEIKKYPSLLLFLIAFLFYNDGIQTIIVVAEIFAREELGHTQGTIISCFLMIQFVAMPGTLLFGRLTERISPSFHPGADFFFVTGMLILSRVRKATDSSMTNPVVDFS